VGALLNIVAVVAFLYARKVEFVPGVAMVAGAPGSGYFGAAFARRVDPRLLRGIVIAVAWGKTRNFFWGRALRTRVARSATRRCLPAPASSVRTAARSTRQPRLRDRR